MHVCRTDGNGGAGADTDAAARNDDAHDASAAGVVFIGDGKRCVRASWIDCRHREPSGWGRMGEAWCMEANGCGGGRSVRVIPVFLFLTVLVGPARDDCFRSVLSSRIR